MLFDDATKPLTSPPQVNNSSRRSLWISLFLPIAIIVAVTIIVLLVFPSVFSRYFPGIKSYNVPAKSMEPTIQENDHVLVSFLSYDTGEPKRGDVVFFLAAPGSGPVSQVKRIVAVGGDVITILPTCVLLNGTRLTEPYVTQPPDSTDTIKGTEIRPTFGPFTVPSNKFFMLGDNRDQSYDSRYYGAVDRAQIKGQVIRVAHVASPSQGWQKIQ
jgi:signal peptidase I